MRELVADNIDMTLESSDGDVANALKDVSFTLKQGELQSVPGPSGCGETTLLDLIAGFLRPTDGSLSLSGAEIDGPGWSGVWFFSKVPCSNG